MLMRLSRSKRWSFPTLENDGVSRLSPMPLNQLPGPSWSMVSLAPWPTSSWSTSDSGFSQIHEKLPVDSFPVWRSAGFTVPSCNSSPGHSQKASGMEVFYYSFGQTGSSLPRAVAGKPSSPQPTPPPGGATPEQVGSASEHGEEPAEASPRHLLGRAGG